MLWANFLVAAESTGCLVFKGSSAKLSMRISVVRWSSLGYTVYGFLLYLVLESRTVLLQ